MLFRSCFHSLRCSLPSHSKRRDPLLFFLCPSRCSSISLSFLITLLAPPILPLALIHLWLAYLSSIDPRSVFSRFFPSSSRLTTLFLSRGIAVHASVPFFFTGLVTLVRTLFPCLMAAHVAYCLGEFVPLCYSGGRSGFLSLNSFSILLFILSPLSRFVFMVIAPYIPGIP